jgi:CMP/dCMP kinase
MKTKTTVITLSRQLGSGGAFIGYSVAKELGYQYIDREILRQAAQRLGMDAGALEHLDERSASLIETIMKGFSFGMPEMSVPLPQSLPVNHKELFVLEGKIMNEIADRYKAVIIGRAGFHALKDRPEVLRVYLYAPEDFRVARIMKARKINNKKEVQAIIKESDQARAKFVRDMAGVEWTDTRNYHFCVDSSAFSFSYITSMIIKMVEQKNS